MRRPSRRRQSGRSPPNPWASACPSSATSSTPTSAWSSLPECLPAPQTQLGHSAKCASASGRPPEAPDGLYARTPMPLARRAMSKGSGGPRLPSWQLRINSHGAHLLCWSLCFHRHPLPPRADIRGTTKAPDGPGAAGGTQWAEGVHEASGPWAAWGGPRVSWTLREQPRPGRACPGGTPPGYLGAAGARPVPWGRRQAGGCPHMPGLGALR